MVAAEDGLDGVEQVLSGELAIGIAVGLMGFQAEPIFVLALPEENRLSYCLTLTGDRSEALEPRFSGAP